MGPLPILTTFCLTFNGFVFTGFYLVLPGLNRLTWVLTSFTWFELVEMGFT